MESDKLQIVYFPYLFFYKYEFVEFLDLTVSNFNKYIGRIEDETLKDKVRTLIFQNQIFGKPIESVGIVDLRGRDNFRPLTDSEIKKCNELRIVLFLVGIAKCNTDEGYNAGHSILTSDNFKMIFQNFTLDSSYTGYTVGEIVRYTDYGYKIPEIKYEKPKIPLSASFIYPKKL